MKGWHAGGSIWSGGDRRDCRRGEKMASCLRHAKEWTFHHPCCSVGRWIEGPLNPLFHFLCKLFLPSERESSSPFAGEKVEDEACKVDSWRANFSEEWGQESNVGLLFNPCFFPFLTASVILVRGKKPQDLGSKKNGWLFSPPTELHRPRKDSVWQWGVG